MSRSVRIAYFLFVLSLCLVGNAFADTNVALSKAVTLEGTFGVGEGFWPYYPPAAASTVTDGIFLPESTTWNDGTVWWNSNSYPDNKIKIDLGGLFNVTSFAVQADNNDSYLLLEYYNGGSLVGTFTVPAIDGWGMTTRTLVLGSPVQTDYLVFMAGSVGDDFRSVSEIQAFGTPVPIPGTLLLVGPGLLGLAGWRRFRKS